MSMGGIYPGQSAAKIGCDHWPPTSTLHGGSLTMQGQGGGALTWSVTVYWPRSASICVLPGAILPEQGTYLPGTGLLGCESWCGAGTPCSGDSPLKFLPTTRGCGASPFPVCTLATSLGGCGFFNSIAVRLPFSSISDGSEWWWFYILFVILMCLCEEASHVGLCHHLDWRSPFNFFLSKFIFRISCWHGSNKII